MARNSRFRTTSGPSSSRPRPDKKKPSGDFGERRESFRSKEKPQGSRPFKKRAYGQPDERRSGDNRFDKTGPRGKEFSKRPRPDKGPDASGSSSDFARRRQSGNPREDRRDSPGRGSKPFSKSDFRRRGPDENRPAKSADRSSGKPGPKRDSEGSSHGKSGYRGERSKGERPRKSPRADEVIQDPDKPKSDLIRLNKFIANSGVCSRREADDLISMGLITVNGKSITELGFKVKATDDVRYEGRRLKSEKPVYVLLNKPKGYITTTDDPQERNTVMQLIQGACKERVYPVGRLDRNTSGLLLLTNDGELTDKLTHPSYNVKKIYKAELNKPLTKADFQKILDGVRLEEGKAIVDDLAIISDDGLTVGIEIHIGWNRVIRRIFEALEYEVVKLDRSVYATLDKKDLARGHWRFLRQDEIIRLKHFQ
jgi:23S rRNA pseudouridine2605 synthase